MFDKIPHIYYYVPPCPKCGSRKTGRYVRQPHTLHPAEDAWYVQTQSLQNGELVRFARRIPYENVYCEDCGERWHFLVRSGIKTEKEIQIEKKARGTEDKYLRFVEDNPKRKKSFFGKICGLLP